MSVPLLSGVAPWGVIAVSSDVLFDSSRLSPLMSARQRRPGVLSQLVAFTAIERTVNANKQALISVSGFVWLVYRVGVKLIFTSGVILGVICISC